MVRWIGGPLQRRNLGVYGGLLLVLVMVSPVCAGDTLVSFAGEPFFIEKDGEYTVRLEVTPGVAIAGVQADVLFDPDVVEITGVTEGNLFSGYNTYFMASGISNEDGRLGRLASVITTPGGETDQTGIFAEIVFKGKEVGKAVLTIENLIVGDISGRAVESSCMPGRIRVTDMDMDDGDGDGITDEWERSHGLNSENGGDALLDRNSDGESNICEYEREFLTGVRGTATEAELGKWDAGGDGLVGLPEAVQGLQAAAGLRESELSKMTGDYSVPLGGDDTDGDGMPDAWESTFGLDPQDPQDALGDLDDDGLSNVSEYLREAWLAVEAEAEEEAREPWDVGNDGLMGLPEAIRALKIVAAVDVNGCRMIRY